MQHRIRKEIGSNIDASVRLGADDATSRENLARYLIRTPFSGEKIIYNAAESTVIYKTKLEIVGAVPILVGEAEFCPGCGISDWLLHPHRFSCGG